MPPLPQPPFKGYQRYFDGRYPLPPTSPPRYPTTTVAADVVPLLQCWPLPPLIVIPHMENCKSEKSKIQDMLPLFAGFE
ncbi:hypothetical protein NL676_038016 [Syzygium grande]|nr:hypothetical protein NL676_038016 [Syzygium grande]